MRKRYSGRVPGPTGLLRSQRGVALIEVLVAIAILGVVASAYLGALVASSRAQDINQKLASAAHLAESQVEYIMNQDYADSYAAAPIPSEYGGYSVAISVDNVTSRGGTLQKICVTVSRSGEPVILSHSDNCTLACYKVAE